MATDIRVGIVGASGHFGYALADPGDVHAEIVAVAPGGEDEDVSRVVAAARDRGHDIRKYDDYRAMLDGADLSAVAINPAYFRHAEITCAALVRGIAVMCEKPLALTADDLAAVRETWEVSNAALGMMLPYRYDARFCAARGLVASGRLGAPVTGYAQKSYKLGTRPDFYRRRETFGGIVPWVGIHAIDWFQYASGLDYLAVTGTSRQGAVPDYPELEDHAVCVFRCSGEASAVMSFDYRRPAAAETHGDDRLRLVCEEGVLEIRGDGPLEVIDVDGQRVIEPQSPPAGLFEDFLRAVSEPDHRPLLPGGEAIRATEIALIARDAVDRREWISINE